MSIYVEILIRGGMDELWEKTQEPKLHQRWDFRFSEIDYLPREPREAQKFIYATHIGAGVRIEGAGESTGERNDSNGQRTSALKFWSDDQSVPAIGSRFPLATAFGSSLGMTIGPALAHLGDFSTGCFFVHCWAGRLLGALIGFGFG
jgi:hypothetical protein